MKKLLLSLSLFSTLCTFAQTDQVVINDKTYDITTLIDRDLGPGVRYTRLRLPGYPLNVNMLRIDVTNPYNRVETTQASDKLYGTESLVSAAKRQTTNEHVVLAGANANFWCVSGQPPFSEQLTGLTYSGNVRNGKIITETNMFSDQWNGGWKHTGIVAVTPDRKAVSGHYKWAGTFNSDATGEVTINCFNKTLRDNEITAYNSYYGTTRTIRCVDQYAGTDGYQHFNLVTGCATEVCLMLDENSQWSAGNDITFTVKEIRKDKGDGTVGSYDLVIAGRGTQKTVLEKLAVGDKVTMRYNWLDANNTPIIVDNLVAGNAQVMVAGELTKYNTSEGYNSQVYSRTGYGVSQDGKMLYIMVIDKSTDAVYGTSKGCSTSVMCAIAKHYGVWDMTNFDAGGSAEMLVDGAIINKTTESNPRAVANGMFACSTAPVDNTITRLEFADYKLQAPIYGSFRPVILGYNRYGALIDKDVSGITLSCPPEAGNCTGDVFAALNKPGTYKLTASLGDVSVSKDIEIMEAQIALRLNPILIDNNRKYTVRVGADVDGVNYDIDPASIKWSIDDIDIATISDEGVLTGHNNGTTTLTAVIGEFTDKATVNVEIPETRYKPLVDNEITDWTTSGTSTKDRKIERAGLKGVAFTYTINGTRSPSVTIKPKTPAKIYSLPDSIRMVINPGDAKITKMVYKIAPTSVRAESVESEVSLQPSVNNVLTIPVSKFVDVNDLASYPLAFTSIQFYLADSNATTHTVSIPVLDAVYTSVEPDQGIGGISADNGSDSSASAAYYNLQGVRVDADRLVPGIYIRVRAGHADKIVIR